MTDSVIIVVIFALIACVFALKMKKLFDEHLKDFDELLAKRNQEFIEILEGIDSDDKKNY